MTCSHNIRPFIRVRESLIFQILSARHATTCIRVEGFFIYVGGATKQEVQPVESGPRSICGEYSTSTVWESGPHSPDQDSYRSGMCLSGRGFLVWFSLPSFKPLNCELVICKIFWARNPSTNSHMLTWSHSLQGLNLCMESKTYVVGTST